MNKTRLWLGWLGLLASALVLTACGADTPTAATSSSTTAAMTTVVATTMAATTTAATTSAATTAAAMTTSAATTSAMTTSAAATAKALRGMRYCEVLPIYMENGKLEQYVYNTQGLNECPDAQWKALNADDLAKSLGAVKVILNGPRYWVMDQIIANGDTAAGDVKTFGDLQMHLRAKVEIPAGQTSAGGSFYADNVVDRNTEYVFKAGQPVYQLVNPQGDVYTMQTYSQIVDPKLTMEDLPGLGSRLKLPTGWQFRVTTPTQDLHLIAKGKAYLIQDDLTNSYQKITQ